MTFWNGKDIFKSIVMILGLSQKLIQILQYKMHELITFDLPQIKAQPASGQEDLLPLPPIPRANSWD